MGQKIEETVIEDDHRNIKISYIFLRYGFFQNRVSKPKEQTTLSSVRFRNESPGYAVRTVSTHYREVWGWMLIADD